LTVFFALLGFVRVKAARKILAFIGPDDSCSHEALAASAWNLPMIAFVSLFKRLAIFLKIIL